MNRIKPAVLGLGFSLLISLPAAAEMQRFDVIYNKDKQVDSVVLETRHTLSELDFNLTVDILERSYANLNQALEQLSVDDGEDVAALNRCNSAQNDS